MENNKKEGCHMKNITKEEAFQIAGQSIIEEVFGKTGTSDYTSFYSDEQNKVFLYSENGGLGYVGLVVIEENEMIAEVFIENTEEIRPEDDSFQFQDLSEIDKIKCLLEYV